MPNPLNRNLALTAALLSSLGLQADMPEGANRTAAPTPGGDQNAIIERATRRATLNAARQAAAKRAKETLAAKGGKVDPKRFGVNPAPKSGFAASAAATGKSTALVGAKGVGATAVPGPGFQLAQPDYMFGTASNWHNTKPIRKFVDTLPGLGAANANNLGNYIPVGVPDTTTYPGSDYYEIDVVEYTQKLHSELDPTRLRGYRQHNVSNTGTVTTAGTESNYLGPLIIAKKDRPVRVKMRNLLPTGTAGDLFIPVDTTMMGAGFGPLGRSGGIYTQNRAEFHLHGGLSPWISDGTPHQWVTPAGETTNYQKGAAFQNVPDMGAGTAGDGIATYYWTNQQSGRLMFYHDHTFGLTRLNVYAGGAAGYLITDPTEEKLINAGILPNNGGGLYTYGIPLILQDKTFVDTTTLGSLGVAGGTDPTWDVNKYGGDGSLWYPHVYMPNQNPADISGANAMGRWDYGPWFWPPVTAAAGLQHGAEPIVGDPNGTEIPGTPNPSLVPEAFLDTPVVNGTAYPRMTVEPKAYRFRILNAANDRFWNLSWFQADSSYIDPVSGLQTEVKMVPAVPGDPTFPATWPTDGREGGVPDPLTAGPSFIQIGNESGFLPTPVEIPAQPVNYNYNRRDIVVLNIQDKALFLGPATRADVVVDFSAYAGKTLILYNDSPAPVPAFDPRLDYFTGSPDQRDSGGTAPTLPGFGPNTRTLMLVQVAASAPAAAFDTAKLQAAFVTTDTKQGAYAEAQHPPIVPETVYNAALNKTYGDTFVRIQDNSMAFTATENGQAVTPYLEPKAIQELFELDYGRMNATLGVELPYTNFNIQTTIPLGYQDPVTETLTDGTTQFWKITHNGVDTHPVHFHLFDVQVINRVGWDGAVRMPDPNEVGWKETVHMNPLEDIVVAMRPLSPRLPFALPNSLRSPNVTQPATATIAFTNPVDGNPINIVNATQNYGWEYVWHCHILGHEENDFMRPMVLNIAASAPKRPSNLAASVVNSGRVDLAWSDNSTNETGFSIKRRAAGTADPFVEIATAVPNSISYSDYSVANPARYDYVVTSYNQAGESATSNRATVGVATVAVSGTVTGPTGPVAGMVINVSNGQSAFTDASGYYLYSVPVGFTGTATPANAGFRYSPASYSYTNLQANQTAQNFSAIPQITISGKVTNGVANLANATVKATSSTGSVVTITTPASGLYSLTVDAPFTGTVSAAATGIAFTPMTQSYTAASTNQTRNFQGVAGVAVTGKVNVGTATGAALAGVQIQFGTYGYTFTDASGNYSGMVPSANPGWTGVLTPSLAGYLFTPATISLSRVRAASANNNFVARQAVQLSGQVTTAGVGLSGVTVTFGAGSGVTGNKVTTAADGTYTALVTKGWTGTVTPSLTGRTFGPTAVTVPAVNAPTVQNFVTTQSIAGKTTRTVGGGNLGGATLTFTASPAFTLTLPAGVAASGTATAAANGNYTYLVPTGWVGTITPSATGYTTWTPANIAVTTPLAGNLTNQNFSGR